MLLCWQVWELVHKGSGYSALVIAIATIYTGLRRLVPTVQSYTIALYFAWVALCVAGAGVLEWLRWHRGGDGHLKASPAKTSADASQKPAPDALSAVAVTIKRNPLSSTAVQRHVAASEHGGEAEQSTAGNAQYKASSSASGGSSGTGSGTGSRASHRP